MKLSEIVLDYYSKENNYSCSEAMIRGCNDYYRLNLSNDVLLASSGFSKGMYAGQVCGAISSGVACLSIMYSSGHAHNSDKMKILISKFNNKCNEVMKYTLCPDLHKEYNRPEIRCSKVVEMTCDILQEIIEEENHD